MASVVFIKHFVARQQVLQKTIWTMTAFSKRRITIMSNRPYLPWEVKCSRCQCPHTVDPNLPEIEHDGSGGFYFVCKYEHCKHRDHYQIGDPSVRLLYQRVA